MDYYTIGVRMVTGSLKDALSRRWLEDLLRQHEARIARRGLEYVGRVRNLRFDAEAGAVTCSVAGSEDEPYVVTLGEPVAEEAVGHLGATCTCPYGESGQFLCKHTFAAATRLAELWDALPSEDVAELVGSGEPVAEPGARPLQLLDAFLNDGGESTGAVEPTARLCWLIKPHRGGPFGAGLSVRAVVETWRSRQWQRSGPLHWDRLLESLDSPELVATAQDREAVLAVRRDEQSYGFHSGRRPLWTIDTVALVAALVGHPRVFIGGAAEQRLEVTAGTLGLAVVVREEGLGVIPAVNGAHVEPRDDGATFFPGLCGVIALDREACRLTVAEAAPKTRRLVAALRPEETVPFLDAEELVARLVRVEPLLPVVWPHQLQGGSAAADGRIHVRLERLDPFGLSVRLAVRPAEQSDSFRPGDGPGLIAASEKGRRVERVRDLSSEAKDAYSVIERLGLAGAARPRPWQWIIEDPEAALRLVERLGELDSDVALVEWPAGEPIRILGTASANAVRVRVGESRDWFRLDGEAETAGQVIPLDDLLAAAVEGREYVALGPTEWVKLGEDLRKLLAALGETICAGAGGRGAIRVTRAAVPAVAKLLGAGSRVAASRGWEKLVAAVEGEGEPEVPGELRAHLRPYQVEGFRWLARRSDADLGCCLADEMGLGKTVQSLAVLLRRVSQGPALIAAPTSIEPNWAIEAGRFAPSLRVASLRDVDGGQLEAIGPGDVILATHELLRRRSDELAKVDWATLVLDEAHAVKNPETRLAEAVRRLRPAWTLALTGTPVENHPGELWAIFHLLAPDLLGPWTRFRKRFAEPVASGDARASERIRGLIGPYLLRRTKEQVLPDLPPCIETTRFIVPGHAQGALYESIRTAAVRELDTGDPDRRKLLAALTRLRQVAAHPGLVETGWPHGSPKLAEIVAVVEELHTEGRRPLVFSPFARHFSLIGEALASRGLRPLTLTGATPEGERAALVSAFQAGEGDAFLISLKAGGMGLNLTAADAVLIADPWWNPAAEAQAASRAHRIGQDRPVTVVRFVVRGTVEEKMLDLQDAKRELAEGLLAGTDLPRDEELRRLLS